jgi:D-xylonolactonase
LWHPVWQELLAIDVPTGEIYRFDAELRKTGSIDLGRPTSAVTWQEDGSIICFHDRGEVSRITDPQSRPQLILRIPDEASGMFNDVAADPRGRILCGALPIEGRAGRLYSIEADLSYRVLLDDVQEPNGLGFSRDGRVLYFVDSVAQTIWKFAYDEATGALQDRLAFHRTQGNELPDGLTIDSNDEIICALWDGACVIRLSATGVLLDRIALPARHVTSVAFGGPALDRLYVTSGKPGEPTADGVDADGSVFRLSGLGYGRAERPSRLVF